jgi:putative DNA methylase
MNHLPKRLIEVDLPIKRISEHARREKDMRRGHIPLLHIYPAARPTASCRAVLCASLWPDPADTECPAHFINEVRRTIQRWSQENLKLLSAESLERFLRFQKNPKLLSDTTELRRALLDLIADFANPDNASISEFVSTARTLTRIAHSSLSPSGESVPYVLDSFSGGGAIPLEAARLGTNAFASDTSPVAVLLNKLILELAPSHHEDLIAEVELQIEWIKQEADKALAEFYPSDPDGSVPTTYLWARTIRCEGPNCGATVPLLRSLRLVRKGRRALRLSIIPHPRKKSVSFEFVEGAGREADNNGTVRKGAATCPICGFTTPVDAVRRQLSERRGGSSDAQLLAVVTTTPGEQGRSYRLPREQDIKAASRAAEALGAFTKEPSLDGLSAYPNEPISLNEIRRISVPLYGMTHWDALYSPRQLVSLSMFARLVREAGKRVRKNKGDSLGRAVQVCLAMLLDKLADMNTSLCVWQNHAEIPAHIFGRWAIGMVFDFAETNPLAQSSGSPVTSGKRLLDGLRAILSANPVSGHAELADAARHPLPDDSVDIFMVDPPYYDAIPYAHLMDFFYLWERRCLADILPDLFSTELIEKEREIVVDRPHQLSTSKKDVKFYERGMQSAFADGRRILKQDGIGVVVFASKTTASWEAILQAIVNAGWVISGSWPIDTEMESRVAAQNQARLASSVHIVCRPRAFPDETANAVGDWRDVLQKLPSRIHEWMPRLAEEGIVGADAIFACLGPALEVFSRYERVEKASGEVVSLKEYLEYVWAAVAKEALSMVFKGADASGFEEDARLTAMWLWTISTSDHEQHGATVEEDDESSDEDSGGRAARGYILEFDAARKIAQGLGARLESLPTVVEVKGETARLLPVAERTRKLFGKDEGESQTTKRPKRSPQMQLGFAAELEEAEEAGHWGKKGVPSVGETVLDRVHQSMILFAAGRGEALRRFLVDEEVGRDQRFWRLAQVLSYLYPSGSEEKRWIDGVLARKKGLGF